MKLIRISIVASLMLALLFIGGCTVAPAVQRTGLVTLNGRPMTLLGSSVRVGEMAPTFKAVANNMTIYHFQPGRGKVWILSSVPSLDTPVCSLETQHFNLVASTLGQDVGIITISMDLPFAQKQWCGDKGVKHIMTVSDYRFHCFAKAYGVLMKQNGLLARQVMVVGKNGKIVYIQLVPNIARPPHYAPVLTAARQAATAPYNK
ncbi:MAG: thiol peroxidase [Phycisphaerae bacterium]